MNRILFPRDSSTQLGQSKMELFHQISHEEVGSQLKVTIVGVGQVGMAAAYSILLQVSDMDSHTLYLLKDGALDIRNAITIAYQKVLTSPVAASCIRADISRRAGG